MKKIIAAVLALVTCISLVACGSRNAAPETTPDPQTRETSAIARFVTDNNIETLNPQRYNYTPEKNMIRNLTTTIYLQLPNDERTGTKFRPVLASEMPVQADEAGLVWNVPIREGMKWWNGDDLDATDIEYSIKMLVDPKLMNKNGSNIISSQIVIKNIEAYYLQETTGVSIDWADVGVCAVDATTLQITVENPTASYEVMRTLADLGTMIVYDKALEESLSADGYETTYGTTVESCGYCGPYYLESWNKGSQIVLKKNPNYVYADMIELDEVVYVMVDSDNTTLQLFESGEIDYVALAGEAINTYKQDPRILTGQSKNLNFLGVNTENPNQPILGNVNFRKALYYAIDREMAANLTNAAPHASVISPAKEIDSVNGIKYHDTDIAKSQYPENHGYNPELARQYFETALSEEGLTHVDISLTYSDQSTYKVLAEYLQNSIPTVLGADKISINLISYPAEQVSNLYMSWRENPANYELAIDTLYGSAQECWDTFKFMISTRKNRVNPWSNETLDEIYSLSIRSEDRFEGDNRLNWTAQMEQILYDQATFIPITVPLEYFMAADDFEPGLTGWSTSIGYGEVWGNKLN